MFVVFGWNHFRIKSFDPFDLGITQRFDSDFRIELRQRYFHLFFIPFFGLGKKWALRRNNQLYEIPVQFLDIIKSNESLRVKSPWYTFAGPILLCLVVLGYNISEKAESYKYARLSEQHFQDQSAENSVKFRKPTPDDYYTLVSANGIDRKYARVTGINKKELQLTYITHRGAYAYQSSEIASLFEKYPNETASVTINRGDSSRLILQDYEKRKNFDGITIKDQYGTAQYRIEKIERMAEPVFISTARHDLNGNVFIKVTNSGAQTTILNIEAIEGTIKEIEERTPALINSTSSFRIITAYGPFKIRLSCTNASGKEVYYLLEGNVNNNHISRVI